jgi:hypothetical protein
MRDNTYQLQPADSLLMHTLQWPQLLHDYDDTQHLDIDALVASGDCFITLATVLDDSTKHLQADNVLALPQIEKTINTLLYLQRHYQVIRKRSEYRQ